MDGYESIRRKYFLKIDGYDLDARAAAKLEPGQGLKILRMDDEEDTYEIVVCDEQGREMDMLSYEESIGIAPFLDDGSVVVNSTLVKTIEMNRGKTRRKDMTLVIFEMEYGYDRERLRPVEIEGTFGFIPLDNMVLAMAIYHCMQGKGSFEKLYQNFYQLDCPVYDRSFLDNRRDSRRQVFLRAGVLFNPKFDRCRVTAKLYTRQTEWDLDLTEQLKLTALTLVNHIRIFEGQQVGDCLIEN